MEKLGQHFLINKAKLQKIAKSLDLKADDTVIEIGPGHGELTSFLAKDFLFLDSSDFIESPRRSRDKFRLILIEKDEEFVSLLKKKFKLDKNISVIKGDALEEIKNQISQAYQQAGKIGNINQESKIIENLKIVGNIPYYITGFLLRILGDSELKPGLVVLTIQKEVAERICVKPPRMNLLAASVQIWAEPKIIDYIPKGNFQPQPKVDSAIIKFNIRKSDFRILEKSNFQQLQQNYYRLIKILFKQPRKTILNNLRETNKTKEEIIKTLEESKISPTDRPQNLSVEQIKNLSDRLILE